MNKTMAHRFAKGLHLTLVKACRVLLLATLGIVLTLTPTLASGAPPRLDEGANRTPPALDSMSQRSDADTAPPGLTAGEWETIQDAIRAAEYHLTYHVATDEIPAPYYQAPNRAQGWHTVFTLDGMQVTPRSGDEAWRWGLALTGYGYADRDLSGFRNPKGLTADKATLTYQWDSNLSEWWVNAPAGLEHGFTLQERPVGSEQSPLVLEMAVTGSLTPVQNGDAIHFQDETSATILTYDKLHVTDAGGKAIPARLELDTQHAIRNTSHVSRITPHVLRILVKDTHAAYPLTIDPWAQTAKLDPDDGDNGDSFGYSVAMSGDTVVVGAYHDEDPNGNNAGSVYIFDRDEGGADSWGQVKKLTASDGAADDYFGASVSISGGTTVVGAYGDDDDGTNSGSAYVFDRDEGGADNWGEVKKLTASYPNPGYRFGEAVAISGDTVVVGQRGWWSDRGAADVFERDQGGAGNWGWMTRLSASDGDQDDQFGRSVAINGDTIVVGASHDGSGSAYVYERDEGGADSWGQVKKLTASDAADGDRFGWSVAISADTIVVGAFGNDDDGTNSGSAYIYERDEGGADNWGQLKKLTASDAAERDHFGRSVTISGDTVVVGVPFDDDNGDGSGSAYVFSPAAPPEPVGGYVVPVNRLGLLAPWLGLGALVALAGAALVLVRRRRG